VLGKLIEVGRVNFPPVATEVGEAHVVGHDQHDVRCVGRPSAACPAQQQCDQKWFDFVSEFHELISFLDYGCLDGFSGRGWFRCFAVRVF
jgi:hypothetical protein